MMTPPLNRAIAEQETNLSAKEWRAMAVIASRAAHDLQERPIEALDALVAKGLAFATNYVDLHGGRLWKCRRVQATDLGWRFINAHPEMLEKRKKRASA